MSDRPRVIIYVSDPQDYVLAARVAQRVTAPGYEWPSDGISMVSFHTHDQEPWQGDTFGCRRNKNGVTIYGPSRPKLA